MKNANGDGLFKIILQVEDGSIEGYKLIKAILRNEDRVPGEGGAAWGSGSIILMLPQSVDPRPIGTTNWTAAKGLVVTPSEQIKNFTSPFDLKLKGLNVPTDAAPPIEDGEGFVETNAVADDDFAYIPLISQEPPPSGVSYNPGDYTFFTMEIPENWAAEMRVAPAVIKEGVLQGLGIDWGIIGNIIPFKDNQDGSKTYQAIEL